MGCLYILHFSVLHFIDHVNDVMGSHDANQFTFAVDDGQGAEAVFRQHGHRLPDGRIILYGDHLLMHDLLYLKPPELGRFPETVGFVHRISAQQIEKVGLANDANHPLFIVNNGHVVEAVLLENFIQNRSGVIRPCRFEIGGHYAGNRSFEIHDYLFWYNPLGNSREVQIVSKVQ